jgi:hypothetical protein
VGEALEATCNKLQKDGANPIDIMDASIMGIARYHATILRVEEDADVLHKRLWLVLNRHLKKVQRRREVAEAQEVKEYCGPAGRDPAGPCESLEKERVEVMKKRNKLQSYIVRWVGVRGTVASGVERVTAESCMDAANAVVHMKLRCGVPDLEIASVADATGTIVWYDPEHQASGLS